MGCHGKLNTYLDIVSSRRTIRAAALMYWSLGEAALEAVARAAVARATEVVVREMALRVKAA